MMATTTTTMNNTTVPKRHRRLAAVAALAGCSILYVICSIADEFVSFDYGVPGKRHLRTEADSSWASRAPRASARIRWLLARLRPSAAPRPPELASSGAGPKLTGLGQTFQFQEARQPGVSWYNALSSSRFEWHVAPYRWKPCPSVEGSLESTFLGDTGFTFRVPDPEHPEDPTKVKTKFLRFRVLRRDERDCLWNHSEACLAGGSLVMNFGRTSRDILRPGDYTLKTSEGVVRIVAYNTNRDCSGQGVGGGPRVDGATPAAAAPEGREKTPMDYLRQAKSWANDPEGCQAWIDRRVKDGDLLSEGQVFATQPLQHLFEFNSDFSIVHVDTPWMQIVIQARQHKVPTDEECIFANMNVRITDIAPGVLEGGLDGILMDANLAPPAAKGAVMERRALGLGEAEGHRVDGPFAG